MTLLGRRTKEVLRFIISILVPLAAGAIGSVATTPAIPTWYRTLTKPRFNPPNWLFAPAWTTLFVLMGIALYLVWRQYTHTTSARPALIAFLVQLALNILWSFAFFGFKSPLAGLIVIIALWVAIAQTISLFSRVSQTAAVLLVPYIAWVSFALVLNTTILFLNL